MLQMEILLTNPLMLLVQENFKIYYHSECGKLFTITWRRSRWGNIKKGRTVSNSFIFNLVKFKKAAMQLLKKKEKVN